HTLVQLRLLRISCLTACCSLFVYATAATHLHTLSLHDALPILPERGRTAGRGPPGADRRHPRAAPGGAAAERHQSRRHEPQRARDRKSTRLNSSHVKISYAVFCLKKKTQQ